jgi:hypothetical protein
VCGADFGAGFCFKNICGADFHAGFFVKMSAGRADVENPAKSRMRDNPANPANPAKSRAGIRPALDSSNIFVNGINMTKQSSIT